MRAPHLDVLHVITDTNRRGAQVFAHDLHEALAERGKATDIVAVDRGLLGEELAIDAMDGSYASKLLSLRRRGLASDVVIAHGSATLRASAMALTGTHVPFVYRSIGDLAYWADSRRRRATTSVLLRSAAAVVALWDGAGATVRSLGVQAERIRIIPQASPIDRYPPPSEAERDYARAALGLPLDAPIFAFVGALAPEKRPSDAIAAVADVPDGWLVIAGDGALRRETELRAQTRLGGRHRFLGQVRDVRRVLVAADALIVPSLTEGMPGVAIEAGLTCRPVVATLVGGSANIVANGSTGFLVPPRSPAQLGAALMAAVAQRVRLGAAARERCAAMFTLDTVVEQWQSVIEEFGRRDPRRMNVTSGRRGRRS
jgi:glycosyltransferase involved in cell wall biosynthesis